MRKVLIVTYKFPPSMYVGATRAKGLARYLPDCDWYPIVLTPRVRGRRLDEFHLAETGQLGPPQWVAARWGLGRKAAAQFPGGTASQVNQRPAGQGSRSLIRRAMHALLNAIYPDPQIIRWYMPAVRRALEIARKEQVDVVLSTAKPVTASLIARCVKQRLAIPWVADLRDLWTGNKGRYYREVHSCIYRYIDRRMERWTLGPADALVTVSQPCAACLQNIHPGKPVFAIPNGFDPEDYQGARRELGDVFRIIYAGSVRPHEVDPAMLFQGLRELIDAGQVDECRIRLSFYGKTTEKFLRDIAVYGLEQIVQVHARVLHKEMMRRELGATLLLLLDWADPEETQVYTGKIFGYLGARRPILTLGREGRPSVIQEVLKGTGTGAYVTNLSQLKQVVREWWDEFEARGMISYDGKPEEVAKYSQVEMARRFAVALNQVQSLGMDR